MAKTSDAMILRPATLDDLVAINDIYNYYVFHSTCTYQEEAESIASRRQWFARHDEKHPIIVATEAESVIGWGSLSSFHERSAYRFSVENSVYVDHRHHRRGIGQLLLTELIASARALGHQTIIAGADADQAASVALHSKFGFKPVAHFKRVGFKFDRWLDVIYMQLMLR